MHIKQWIYTTSCWNITGIKGWATFSYSQNLSSDEVQELENKSYVDNNLHEAFFPVVSMLTLSTGRQALCRTVYLGNSFYDGRPGALLTHALIIENGEQWPCTMAECLNSGAFLDDLPQEIKEKALMYREMRSEAPKPDYLPELTEHDITPTDGDYTHTISQWLQDDTFAANISRIIREYEKLDAEERPLRYTCAPQEYTPYILALSMLLPEAFKGQSAASIFRTMGMVSRYNFLALTGTQDHNSHIDLTHPSYQAEDKLLHPLVRLARNNIGAIKNYDDHWSHLVASTAQTKSDIVNLLDPLAPLEDKDVQTILKMPETDISAYNLQQIILLIAQKTHSFTISSTVLALFTKLNTLINSIADTLSAEVKDQANTLLCDILSQISSLIAADELTPQQVAEGLDEQVAATCLSNTNAVNALFSSAESAEAAGKLMQTACLLQTCADTAANTRLLSAWHHLPAVCQAIDQINQSESVIQELLSAMSHNDKAFIQIVQLLLTTAGKQGQLVTSSLNEVLQTCDILKICNFISALQSVSAADSALVNTCIDALLTKQFGYGDIEPLIRSLSSQPEILLSVISAALQHLNGQAYTYQEAKYLLQILPEPQFTDIRQDILLALDAGFPTEHLINEHMGELAVELTETFNKEQFSGINNSIISILSHIQLLGCGEEELRDYTESTFASQLEDVKNSLSSQDAHSVKVNILKYLIHQKKDYVSVHATLMSGTAGISQEIVIQAYTELLQDAQEKPMGAFCLSVLKGMQAMPPSGALRSMLSTLAETMFRHITRATFKQLKTELERTQFSGYSESTDMILSYANQYKPGFFSFLFG